MPGVAAEMAAHLVTAGSAGSAAHLVAVVDDPTRRSGPVPQNGFTLVEAVVALTLLAVGLLGAAATQSLAARLLGEAEARTGAVVLAGAVLDSLLTVPRPHGGARTERRYRVHWSTVARDLATVIELEVEYQVGANARRLRFEMVHVGPLARIGGGW